MADENPLLLDQKPEPSQSQDDLSLPPKPSRLRDFLEKNAIAIGAGTALVCAVAAAIPIGLSLLPHNDEADRQAERIAQTEPFLSAEISAMPPRLRLHNNGFGPAVIRAIFFSTNDGTLLLDTSKVPQNEEARISVKEQVEAVQAKFTRASEAEELGLSGIPIGSLFVPSGQTDSVPVGGYVTLYEIINIDQINDIAGKRGQQQAFFKWASGFTEKTEVQVSVLYTGMAGGCYALEVGKSSVKCDPALASAK